MYPLIEIETIPIQISMKIKGASLEYSRGTAEMEISRSESGGLNIKSRPIRLQLDSFEARNSISPTTARSVDQAAQKGQQAGYEATSTYARQGDLLMNAKMSGEVLKRFSQEAIEKPLNREPVLDFLPDPGVKVEWEDGDMQIRYEMDKLNFDWKIESGKFQFTPGDIEISVEQKPDIIIRYMGGPMYVPPSADPNYEPVDVEA